MRSPSLLTSALSFGLVTITIWIIVRQIIPTLEHPFWQPGDWGSFPFTRFIFGKTVSWFPIPHFSLPTDWYFYPYGTDSLYLNWGLERDLFFNILSFLFGEGPWFFIYFMLSLLITGWGLWWILKQAVSAIQASFIASLIVGFNFYVYAKFPGHFNLCIVHWTLLSIAADHVITRMVWRGATPPPILIAFRLFLTIAALGLELGYVAGYSFLSLILHLPFICFALPRYATWSWQPKNLLLNTTRYFRQGGWGIIGILILIIITAWLYLPLILEIKLRADQFRFPFFDGGYLWSPPLLGAAPYLPGGETLRQALLNILGGASETPFDWRPGWTLLFLSGWGLWYERKTLGPVIPLLLLLILCIVYHPFLLPTLKLFPWHTYHRVSARATLILPTILALLTLAIPWKELLKGRISRQIGMGALLLALLAIGAMEFRAGHPYRGDLNLAGPDLFRYAKAIADYPGEAVLDWPFCIIGGNGFLTNQQLLCPDYEKLAQIGFLGSLHGKKVVGQYLGRLHYQQTRPFLKAGWDQLIKAVIEKRCFTSEEWSFFEEFFARGDFSGISLYKELIPLSCVEEFIKRFGPPTHSASIPITGQALFIPKPERLKALTDLGLARNLRYILPIKPDKLDLVREPPPQGVSLAGLDNKLSLMADGRVYRASFDLTRQAEVILRFGIQGKYRGRLQLAGINQVPAQTLTLFLNDRPIGETIGPLQSENSFGYTAILDLNPGVNEVVIRFRRTLWLGDAFMKVWCEQGWRGGLKFSSYISAYRQTEARAVEFQTLELTFEPMIVKRKK